MRNSLILQRVFVIVATITLAVGSVGCGAYQLSGTVIHGPKSEVVVVHRDDERLQLKGLAGARVDFIIDPQSIRPNVLPPVVTDDRGQFSLPVNEAGAGFMLYDLQVAGRRSGYRSVFEKIALPGGDKRLLIIMAPGQGGPGPNEDVIQESLRAGEQFK